MRAEPYKIFVLTVILWFFVDYYAIAKNMTEFTWGATECAPKGYPMEIISGTFLFKGEDHGLYIPAGGTLTGGWGNSLSNHGSILHSLPDRLKITFFSYAEKKFYHGEFALPYDRLVALFQEGVQTGEVFPVYTKMMAGIAPGGVVSVWVTGKSKVEVFFGQAEETHLDPSIAFDLPFDSAEEADDYMAKGLLESVSPDELRSIKENGIPFDLWSRYRNRYHWFPRAKEGYVHSFSVHYVNGESEKGHFPFVDSENKLRLLPVPRQLLFETKDHIYDVHFDHLEIVAAFEQLNAHENLTEEQRRIALELDLQYPRSNSRAKVYNAKESIELEKVVFDDW
ncbi:DUF2931 family protein [Sulfuriflexus mobilis]|uniref:DUF2931 family protein n=1 Tax=Sulfuriflexus mobilis TaxID=1811807 RepID=UPI000F81A62E|nr:DUF2931 family protein [Sulfuriflexus mobilis]